MRRRWRMGIPGVLLIGAFASGLAAPSGLWGYEKKLRVTSDYAQVYLQPDTGSPIVDTINRGIVLSLLYSGKLKKSWYYICFKSEKTGHTKSGYVLDSEVELLFDPLLSITIQEERPGLTVEYPPRHFDEMQWGLTKKQVVETEGKPTSQAKTRGGDVLVYGQKVINYDCDIEYRFQGNRLLETRFRFAGDAEDGQASLDDYRKVKDALIRRFGKPDEENMNWRDTAYKDDFSSWGRAVGLGQLELSSHWQTPRSAIEARLAGANGATSLVVLYTALRIPDLARKNNAQDED